MEGSSQPFAIPNLEMLVDRTSFDETDNYGVNKNALPWSNENRQERAVVMHNGRIRRRLRWRPKKKDSRKKVMKTSDASVNSHSNTSIMSISNTSRGSKTSEHSISSTQTVKLNNTRNPWRRFTLPRPSYPQKSSGVTTIGTEGSMLIMKAGSSRMIASVDADTAEKWVRERPLPKQAKAPLPPRPNIPKALSGGFRKSSVVSSSGKLESRSSSSLALVESSGSGMRSILPFSSHLSRGNAGDGPDNSEERPSLVSTDSESSTDTPPVPSSSSGEVLPALSIEDMELGRQVDLRIRPGSNFSSEITSSIPAYSEMTLDELRNTFGLVERMDSKYEIVPKSISEPLLSRNSMRDISHTFSAPPIMSSSLSLDESIIESDELRFSMQSSSMCVGRPTSETKAATVPVDLDEGTFLEAEKNLHAIHDMAAEHLRHGEHAEALEVFEEIHRGQLVRYGPHHYRVGTALQNIAIVHMKRGDFNKAISICREAVEVRKAALGADHPDVAVSLAQLGVAYLEVRKHRKSVTAFREALQIRRHCFGNNHLKVAKILNNIGCALYEMNELEVARVAFEEALQVQRYNLRNMSSDSDVASNQALLSISSTLSNIGSIKLLRGEHEEAQKDLEEALLIQQSVLGDQHPHAIRTQQSLEWIEKENFANNVRNSTSGSIPTLHDLFLCRSPIAHATQMNVMESLENRFMALQAGLDMACGESDSISAN